MNVSEFEAQLETDGYAEIEMLDLAPRPGRGRHRHLFAIRGLVLSGTFTVMLAQRISDPSRVGSAEPYRHSS